MAAGWAMATVWWNRASNKGLLLDTDTRGLLIGINERKSPFSWFWTDWPIYNHFYRPFPSLAFEWDNWVHHESASGFGATNAIIVMLCVGLLAWVGTLLFESAVWGALSAVIFSMWLLPGFSNAPQIIPLTLFGWVIWACVTKRGRWSAGKFCLFLFLIWAESMPIAPLYFRTAGWLPGRTATIMTLFTLVSLAAFLSGVKLKSPAWMVVSLLTLLAALGSYEQAVMMPLILTLFWLIFGRPAVGRWLVTMWGLLFACIAFRSQIIPPAPSRYQNQQFRSGPGVWLSLTSYLAPPLGSLSSLRVIAETGFVSFFVSLTPWWMVAQFPAFFGSAGVLAKANRWRLPFFLLIASALSFGPMAFLKPFDHYHFWPMTWRALFLVSLIRVVLNQDEADE